MYKEFAKCSSEFKNQILKFYKYLCYHNYGIKLKL